MNCNEEDCSAEDKVENIFLFGECGRNYCSTARRFNELYPERPNGSHHYVCQLVNKFRETENLRDRPRSVRPKVDENTVIEVIANVTANPKVSLAQIKTEL